MERELPLARIDGLIERAVHGHGTCMFVRGRAGIGKTALLSAAAARCRASGLTVLRACGDQLLGAESHSLSAELIAPLLDGPRPGIRDEVRAIAQLLDDALGTSVDPGFAQQALGRPPWSGPEHCCGSAKVAALERALTGADEWITGLRRERWPTRAGIEPVEIDRRRRIAKFNPLALWTERDLWARIHERGLPYHPLHDEGYASIGYATCTLPGDGRDGRWAGTEKTECGLHV